MELRGLLDFLENNIDLEHAKKAENLHINALNYDKVPFLPISIAYPVSDDITPFPYTQAYDDPAKMLFNELTATTFNVYNSVKLKDYHPLQIRSNHGVGIIASLFGAKCRIVQENMPWVDHVESLDDIKKIILHGVPECDQALGKKVKEAHQFYLDALKPYPKCSKAIHLTQPDMQGPFDIAHLLIGTNIFYEVYDNPEILQELLDLITRTYIKFRKFVEPWLTDKTGDDSRVVHGAVYGGKVILKDDTALINLSEKLYKDFSRKYNERILNEFDGGSLHYCGPMREWHNRNINYCNLRSLNLGNPEMHDIAEKHSWMKASKISIVGLGDGQGTDYIDKLLQSGIKTGITLVTNAKTFKEGKDFLERYTSS